MFKLVLILSLIAAMLVLVHAVTMVYAHKQVVQMTEADAPAVEAFVLGSSDGPMSIVIEQPRKPLWLVYAMAGAAALYMLLGVLYLVLPEVKQSTPLNSSLKPTR